MPCVCLRNTFRHWQMLATSTSSQVKPAPAHPSRHSHRKTRPALAQLRPHFRRRVKPAKDLANKGIFSDSEVLRIPHSHHARTATPTKPKAPAITLPRHGKPTRADLINAESRLGSAIFGPIPEGHRREFFHDRQNIWIWHEDWRDGDKTHQMTVRYEVHTSGIYKKVSTGKYLKLEGEELDNFRRATRAYLYMIKKYLYNRPQSTSKSTQPTA